MNGMLRERLGESLWTLAAAMGTPLIGADDLTGQGADGVRRTFRLSFENGRILKGRRFATAARAAVVWRILTAAGAPGLARAVSHEGDAMLEEWLEGEVLVLGQVDDRRLREAGRILGALHARPLPPIGDLDVAPADGDAWVVKTAVNLRVLRERGLLTAARADHLEALIVSSRPVATPIGIVHRDLCPENLLLDTRGRLVSVDNASMAIGAIEYDLARVWYRWPMTEDERASFNAGYQEHHAARGAGEPSLFWAIVVVVNSARVRLGTSTAAAAAALDRLERHVP